MPCERLSGQASPKGMNFWFNRVFCLDNSLSNNLVAPPVAKNMLSHRIAPKSPKDSAAGRSHVRTPPLLGLPCDTRRASTQRASNLWNSLHGRSL